MLEPLRYTAIFGAHFRNGYTVFNQMIEIIRGVCVLAADVLVCVHRKLLSVQFSTHNRILYENRFIFSTAPYPVDSGILLPFKYVIKTMK